MSQILVSQEILVEPAPHVASSDHPKDEFPRWVLESPHNKALSALCYTSMLRHVSQSIASFSTVRALRLYFESLASIFFELSSTRELRNDDVCDVPTSNSEEEFLSDKDRLWH